MSEPLGLLPAARYWNEMAGMIARVGWAVQGVFGETPEDMFSYTIGLTDKGLPELWIGTLGPQQSQPVLNGLAELALSRHGRGEALPIGEPIDAEYSVPFRLRGPVDVEAAEAFGAVRWAIDKPVTLLQVLWPDNEGRFPDQDGYDQGHFPQRVLPLAAPVARFVDTPRYGHEPGQDPDGEAVE